MSKDPENPPISAAYAAVMDVIGSRIPARPLPAGINTCDAGDWTLTVNCGKVTLQDVPPWSVMAQHKVFFVIACLGPFDGVIGGGMEEDEFIEQMKALAAPEGAHHVEG